MRKEMPWDKEGCLDQARPSVMVRQIRIKRLGACSFRVCDEGAERINWMCVCVRTAQCVFDSFRDIAFFDKQK